MDWKAYERHPLSAEYEDIKGKPWERFVENLKLHGIINDRKVMLWEGKVIDAWQLYRGCIEADLEPTIENLELPEGMAIEEWVETVQDLRRHESQKRIVERAEKRRERVVAARQQGMSTRAIAEQEGITQTQVLRDLKASTETGVSVDPPGGQVVSQDGRKRPAKKAPIKCERCTKLKLKRENCPQCEALQNAPEREAGDDSKHEEEAAADAAMVDANDQALPEQAIPAFKAVAEIRAWARRVDELVREAREFTRGPAGRLMSLTTIEHHLRDAKANAMANLPTHVCPYCHGKKDTCDVCKGDGWTAKHIYAAAPGVNAKSKKVES